MNNLAQSHLQHNFSVKKRTKKIQKYCGNPNKRSHNSKSQFVYDNCLYFRDYLNYCVQNNFSNFRNRRTISTLFLRYLNEELNFNLSTESFQYFTLQIIEGYEQHLIRRIYNDEISSNSAYIYLLNAKYFLDYLFANDIIDFKYHITDKINQVPVRTNVYITQEQLNQFLTTILSKRKTYTLRNFCMFLILIETGCRPIELTNITIDDLHITERTIALTSRKSRIRTLKLDPQIIDPIVTYLNERTKIRTDHNFLFVSHNRMELKSNSIKDLAAKYNQLAFGGQLINPKSLRHTFATNSLDKNDYYQVSEAMGHKWLNSTMHYYYRNKHTILKKTLRFNPIDGVKLK